MTIRIISTCAVSGPICDMETVLNPAVRAVTEWKNAVSTWPPFSGPFQKWNSLARMAAAPSRMSAAVVTNTSRVWTRKRRCGPSFLMRRLIFATAQNDRSSFASAPSPPMTMSAMMTTCQIQFSRSTPLASPSGRVEKPALQKAETEWKTA